jgi:hypothetical protein
MAASTISSIAGVGKESRGGAADRPYDLDAQQG